ncbi:MAG: hypothetical protein KC910_04925 [Candidatus Eremiobacteraeota bacterium]|nr:hypothetical protein [Candidatus Eremiobacteraeota bacterium]
MKTASRLMEEFETLAQSVRVSPQAAEQTPGVMVIKNQRLNAFRDSLASARLCFEANRASDRFFDRVGHLNLSETSSRFGRTITRQWHYEREGSSESYLYLRHDADGRVSERACLKRNIARNQYVFHFNREELA